MLKPQLLLKISIEANSNVFTILFPHVIHPLTYTGMSGSILTTLAISIERFAIISITIVTISFS